MSDFQYDWGDTVRITPLAPVHLRPGSTASVCGMRRVAVALHGSGEPHKDGSVGLVLYLIEFGDGFTVELPEEFLQPVDEQHSTQAF